VIFAARAPRSPGDWGRGSAGPLGGEGFDSQQDRDRDRKRGFRDQGSKLAGLAAWDKDVKGWVEDV
jgi:hypothetical protein